jgi:hypothetical protein
MGWDGGEGVWLADEAEVGGAFVVAVASAVAVVVASVVVVAVAVKSR